MRIPFQLEGCARCLKRQFVTVLCNGFQEHIKLKRRNIHRGIVAHGRTAPWVRVMILYCKSNGILAVITIGMGACDRTYRPRFMLLGHYAFTRCAITKIPGSDVGIKPAWVGKGCSEGDN